MSRVRDSRGFKHYAFRAVGVLLLLVVATIAVTLVCGASEQDDVTAAQLTAQLAPPAVVDRIVAIAPPPPLSLAVAPAYQPPRNA
jgi:hypothetical protein